MSLVKRQKLDSEGNSGALIASVKRTSGLSAPIIKLTGAHSAEITSVSFNDTGSLLIAVSVDQSISIWNTYPPHDNIGLISHAHSGPILALSIYKQHIWTAAADKTVAVHCLKTGKLLRRLRGHTGVVNCISVTRKGDERAVSGSDDGTLRIWSADQKLPLQIIQWESPVLAVEFSAEPNSIFVAGLDNNIHLFDLENETKTFTLHGHYDSICSLALNREGTTLASYSFDSSLKIWDVRPFCPGNQRLKGTLLGNPAGFEHVLGKISWSEDGERIAAGGADRCVTIWNTNNGEIIYKLPGHAGTVTAVDLHPREPIVVTTSKDTTIILGEIEPASS